MHPTHAIAIAVVAVVAAVAAAVVGPRFWLSPVDVAINFHAYLLFCRTSLIIKNKSIFNGVFEKQTLLDSSHSSFGSSYFGSVLARGN